MLKYELERALRTPEFICALAAGLMIVLLHIIFHVVPALMGNIRYLNISYDMMYPQSSYISWIVMDRRLYMYIFLFIAPILAALPYASSLYTDIRGSMAVNVMARTGKKRYLRSKYAAVFLSGGIVCCLPLVIDMLICMMLLPSVKPEPAANTILLPKSSMAGIFYDHPLVYSVISLLFIFVFCGLIAVFALTTTYYVKYKYTIYLVGFIVALFIISLCDLLGTSGWQPTSFLAGYYTGQRIIPFLAESAILLILSVTDYFMFGMKRDLQ